jgi:hypothetical protein
MTSPPDHASNPAIQPLPPLQDDAAPAFEASAAPEALAASEALVVPVVAAAPTASIVLRTASSPFQFRMLAMLYLSLLAYAWWPLALVTLFLMPLFCAPTNPRRALWLWTAGMLAGAMSLMASRSILHDMGRLSHAFASDPNWASAGLGLGLFGAAIMIWHLTWVKSPRA